jgi:hypothetical protein
MGIESDDPAPPDLAIGHLELWVHRRELPEAHDYWDGNWLNVTARYRRGASTVAASGAFLHASEIVEFASQCTAGGND